jgi:hypothetical protein
LAKFAARSLGRRGAAPEGFERLIIHAQAKVVTGKRGGRIAAAYTGLVDKDNLEATSKP